MNSIVRPIFNEKLLKSEVCGSYEQYTGPTDAAENELKNQILWLLFMNNAWTVAAPSILLS